MIYNTVPSEVFQSSQNEEQQVALYVRQKEDRNDAKSGREIA
jgi:hypothetical protein